MIKNRFHFVNFIFRIIFSNKILLPTLTCLLVALVKKEINSKYSYFLPEFEKGIKIGKIAFLNMYILLSMANICLISIYYCSQPLLESYIRYFSGVYFTKKILNLSFLIFFNITPEMHLSLILRNVTAIGQSVDLIVFGIIGSILTSLLAIKKIFKILDIKYLFILSSLVFLGIVFLILLSTIVRKIKLNAIKFKDFRSQCIKDILINFNLVKMNNSKDIDIDFSSPVLLSSNIASETLSVISNSTFILINQYIMTYFMIWEINNVERYLNESSHLFDSIKVLISTWFKLENKRFKLNNLNIDNCTDFEPSKLETPAIENHISPDDLIKKGKANIRLVDYQKNHGIHCEDMKSIEFLNVNIKTLNDILLQDVNLNISKGDKIALIGKNGSGKSTFLRFFMSFMNHDGKIKYNDIELETLGILRGNINYIPQNFFLEGTIFEIFSEAQLDEVFKIAREIGKEAFIRDNLNKNIEELSMYEQQIIKIILGCFEKKSILLADEPIECFDHSLQEKIANFLMNKVENDIKIVSIHSFRHIDKFNRVFLVEDGHILSYSNYKNA